MKITEDIRKYDAEQGIAEEEALKNEMNDKSPGTLTKAASFTRRLNPAIIPLCVKT